MTDIASASGGNIYMKWGVFGGGFTSNTYSVANLWGNSGYTWVEDFDGNGLPDIASASGGNVYMKLAKSIPSFHFDSYTWPISNAWGQAEYTRVARFQNGRPSIFTAVGCTIYHHIPSGLDAAGRFSTVTN